MAPIFESDVAENRWKDAEWQTFELAEEVERRIRIRERLWIGSTVVLFLVLASIPVLSERLPAWRAQKISRLVAEEWGRVRLEAGRTGSALRMRFESPLEASGVRAIVERAETCSATSWSFLRSWAVPGSEQGGIQFVEATVVRDFGWDTGVVDSVCYEAQKGMGPDSPVLMNGLAFGPSEDIMQRRADRVSVLLISGASAEPQL